MIEIGQQIGNIIVIAETKKNGKKAWICKCLCGNDKEIIYPTSELNRNQESKSCGCLKAKKLFEKYDLTGKKFSRLTVREFAGRNSDGKYMFLCDCECGNTTIVQSSMLQNENTKSCGCLHKESITKKLEDLTGKIIGRLLVVKLLEDRNSSGARMWECLCECGNTTICSTATLNSKHTQSCGCLHKEKMAEMLTTHGMRYSYIYDIYHAQYQRCNNPNNAKYHRYGGRGIKLIWTIEECIEWAEKNPRPVEENGQVYQIDRINNDGHYELSNIRWATVKDNVNNRSVST